MSFVKTHTPTTRPSSTKKLTNFYKISDPEKDKFLKLLDELKPTYDPCKTREIELWFNTAVMGPLDEGAIKKITNDDLFKVVEKEEFAKVSWATCYGKVKDSGRKIFNETLKKAGYKKVDKITYTGLVIDRAISVSKDIVIINACDKKEILPIYMIYGKECFGEKIAQDYAQFHFNSPLAIIVKIVGEDGTVRTGAITKVLASLLLWDGNENGRKSALEAIMIKRFKIEKGKFDDSTLDITMIISGDKELFIETFGLLADKYCLNYKKK